MSAFCGDEPLWDSHLFMTSHWPRTTSCFQHTILVYVPCGWLWLSLVPHLHFLFRRHQGVTMATDKMHLLRTMSSSALAILTIVQFVRLQTSSKSHDHDVTPAVYLAFVLHLLSYLLTIALMHLDRIQGYTSSIVLWVFWCLSVITNIVPFYSNICLKEYDSDSLVFAMFYVKFVCLCVQLVLATLVDSRRHLESHANPELTASVPSKLFFWWISSFIFRSYREGVQEEDLFDLHPRDKANRVISQFELPWQRELQQYQQLNGNCDSNSDSYSSFERVKLNNSASFNESSPLIGRASLSVANGNAKKTRKPSFFKVLVQTYAMELVQSHFFMLLFDLLQFANPLLLGFLIDYAKDKRESGETTMQWPGYAIGLGFFMAGLVSSLALNQCYHLGMTFGMRVKDTLIAAIYKKSLNISTSANQNLRVETTVKLMSQDCQRIQDLMAYLWMLWSAPLEIVLASYFLWRVIGRSMLWGVAVMLVLMPVNAYLAWRQKRHLADLAKVKNKRIKLTKELLEGVQVYKIYAWERNFQIWIDRIRAEEIKILKRGFLINAISTFCWSCSPFLVLLATFADHVVSEPEHPLDAHTAFVCLALFNILRFPVNLLPMLFTLLFQSVSTLDRLGKFLTLDDFRDSTEKAYPTNEFAIEIERGHFTWDKTLKSTTLSGLDLQISPGQLVAVAGHPGCGKSSLLSVILGQMDRLLGSVKVKSNNIIHVTHQPWVQSSSVKDNVLFGKPKNRRRYTKVMAACCLKDEVELLPCRDKTEVGERGMTLSQSQKQRLALARAVYGRADVYLLDEPLCDVNTATANQIFANVISNRGLLQTATRLLVTNSVHWLKQADVVIMMTDGRVSEVGTFDQLWYHEGHLRRFIEVTAGSLPGNGLAGRATSDHEEAAMFGADQADQEVTFDDIGISSADEFLTSTDSPSNYPRRFELTDSTAVEEDVRERDRRIRDMLLAEERAEITRIRPSVFLQYLKTLGLTTAFASLFFFLAYQAVHIVSNVWLVIWTSHGQSLLPPGPGANGSYHSNHTDGYYYHYSSRDDEDHENSGVKGNASGKSDEENPFYLGIYGLTGALQALFVISFSLVSSYGMTEVSRILHGQVLGKVLRSPMAFFDQMPSARLMSRFSRDLEVLDTLLPLHMRSWMNTFFGTVSTVVIISYCTPVFLAVLVPVGLLYYLIQRYYIPTSRQLKNLESTSRTSLYTLFRDTITGVSTIRCLGASDRLVNLFLETMDKNTAFHYASISTNRWLAIGVEMTGTLVVTSTAMLTLGVGDVDESLVGLAVAISLQVTSGFSWMVRALTDLETNVYSVQRMRELTLIAPESPRINPFKRPQASWPELGAIHFFNCTTQPRRDLYPALKPLNLYIQPGEKIAIVGKSSRSEVLSIRDALFRIVEATSGSIIIDNTIISDIGLHDLRSRMTYLPGVPVLFSGTLRMNLDPCGAHSEDDVWGALEKAGIKEFFSSQQAGLRFDCGENGGNLSIKQRHLVSLGRALLARRQIVVMEETKTVLEADTEDFIQTAVRVYFKDCTVLTFASRINTVVDYDRVVVLDEGVLVEADNPKWLLRNPASALYHLASLANLL